MSVAPGFVEIDVAASVLSGAVIGDEAAGQVQRDVLGEALAAAHVGWEAGFTPEGRAWSMQR